MSIAYLYLPLLSYIRWCISQMAWQAALVAVQLSRRGGRRAEARAAPPLIHGFSIFFPQARVKIHIQVAIPILICVQETASYAHVARLQVTFVGR